MARTRKIALIGARGYQTQSADLRVDCFSWDKLTDIKNIRDYDIVLLNLLSVKRDAVDWSSFCTILNIFSIVEILRPGGRIIVIGDPRFTTCIKSSTDDKKKIIEEPFLAWTGIKFYWDNQPGDTVIINDDWYHRIYEEYLKSLKRWEYSLGYCKLDFDVFGKIYNLNASRSQGLDLRISEDRFCRNRYGGALAFSITIVLVSKEKDYRTGRREIIEELGPIVFLPKTNLNEDETIMIVLRDLCGVESELPEPEWIGEFEAPGQKTIDDEIRRIRAQIESLLEDLRSAEAKREKARMCLKLLYERGEPLEKTVREILRGLGAHVEDPQERGKEDGWVTVQVTNETFEGVLEVKSTRNPQFDEEGLRQLLDWISRGVELRQKKYKGIFVGSNFVDKPLRERPWAFSDNWKKSAELHQIVAMKAEDLYLIHLLNASGKLNIEEFWRRLFGTNGIFDRGPCLEMLAPKESKTET